MLTLQRGEAVPFNTLTPARMKEERAVSGDNLISTSLLVRGKPSEVTVSAIEAALVQEVIDISRVKISKYGIDPEPYYNAYYAACDTQYSPVTRVRVWYSLR
jgi:hypothetical protein